MTTTTTKPCYYCNSQGDGCAACNPDLDDTPAGITYRAVRALDGPRPGHLEIDANTAAHLADLLQVISDDMKDNGAVEKEHPEHIPSARWQIVDEHGRDWMHHPGWDEALALSRAIVGLPNPNAAGDVR